MHLEIVSVLARGMHECRPIPILASVLNEALERGMRYARGARERLVGLTLAGMLVRVTQ